MGSASSTSESCCGPLRRSGVLAGKMKLYYSRGGRGFKVPLFSHQHLGILTVHPGQQLPTMVMTDLLCFFCREIHPSKQPHLHGCCYLRVETVLFSQVTTVHEAEAHTLFLGFFMLCFRRKGGGRDWKVPSVLQQTRQHH